MVYDVTDRHTFENIESWVSQIQKHADVHVNKVLIGNKMDKAKDQIQVSTEMGAALAGKHSIPFFETSAKQNINVSPAFEEIARAVKKRLESTADDSSGGRPIVNVNYDANAGQGKKKGCC